ncbi:hypothetical protein BDF22DRAFT_216155 [Syncephalis plumigaleata]|nr:hypothetical protein BDF22DRAFT_216155 [Syncephalis plumigaleata]
MRKNKVNLFLRDKMRIYQIFLLSVVFCYYSYSTITIYITIIMTTEIPQDIVLPEHPFGPDSLYWSNDHQLLAVTRSTLFILTPNKERRCLGQSSFYQMIIQRDIMDTNMVAINGVKRAEISIAKGRILSSRGFHQAQWSPIGCAPYHGCLIAAIVDTNRHVVFYAPQSHPATFSCEVPACIAFGYQTERILVHIHGCLTWCGHHGLPILIKEWPI